MARVAAVTVGVGVCGATCGCVNKPNDFACREAFGDATFLIGVLTSPVARVVPRALLLGVLTFPVARVVPRALLLGVLTFCVAFGDGAFGDVRGAAAVTVGVGVCGATCGCVNKPNDFACREAFGDATFLIGVLTSPVARVVPRALLLGVLTFPVARVVPRALLLGVLTFCVAFGDGAFGDVRGAAAIGRSPGGTGGLADVVSRFDWRLDLGLDALR